MTPVNLLLADDETAFVEIIAQRLRERNFNVLTAASGPETLNCIDMNGDIDAVILDVSMPGMDGLETLKEIKRKQPLVEVIMLTGNATVKSATEAIKFGAFDYLLKPFELEELVSGINNAVSRKRQREAEILEVHTKPYLSRRERDDLVAGILKTPEK